MIKLIWRIRLPKLKLFKLRPFIHEGKEQDTSCTAHHGEPLLFPCLRICVVLVIFLCWVLLPHPQATSTDHGGPRTSDLPIERRSRNHFITAHLQLHHCYPTTSPPLTFLMWFLRIAEELSKSLKNPAEDSPFVLCPHIPDCVILMSQALFFATQGRFFASRIFTWYYNCCSRNCPSRYFSPNLKQDLSGLSGFFRRLRSKPCFKLNILRMSKQIVQIDFKYLIEAPESKQLNC